MTDPRERSRQETLLHISKVQARMEECIAFLKARANAHDLSKLQEPELSGYASLSAQLSEIEYGSPEYRQALAGRLRGASSVSDQ